MEIHTALFKNNFCQNDFEIALLFLIIATIIVLFAFEIFPMDKIVFCIIGVLILFGLVTPEEGISGFSNTAVITILCLMIIAAALAQNGVISWMANGPKRFKGWPIYFIVPAFMFITGSISAFISSTAVAIVFIKIVTELSDKYDISKSKLLLPISISAGMELPSKPFVLAVMFAANFSFLAPVGYRTNSLIFSMGIYRFRHCMEVGGVISLVLFILGTLLLGSMV
ncbi:SLC13 family permease [Pricia sp.]|uniref:SLC13 family permease n=1 Tax=Pricia sp. TaxID=2268138 RepID=UPI0035939389